MKARIEAAELSLALRKGDEIAINGSITLGELLGRYLAEVSVDKSDAQRGDDERRADLLMAGIGVTADIRGIDRNVWKAYARRRQAGRLQVEGRRIRPVGNTTLRHELVFLRGVLTWAATTVDQRGQLLLATNHLAGVTQEKSPAPAQPITTFDRFLRVYRHSNRADPTGRFRAFLAVIEGKGWRLSAVCALRASDLDLRRTAEAPFGRILKRRETDKMGKERWALLTRFSRKQIDRLLRRHPTVGRAYLFPSPTQGGECWQDQYALDLLHKAEVLAGHEERLAFLREVGPRLEDEVVVKVARWTYPVREYCARHWTQVERKPALARKLVAVVNEANGWDWTPTLDPELGHGFHGLRRKWATERKVYPLADVAYEGDWDEATLLNFYQKADPRTRVAVALAPEKLREVRSQGPLRASDELRPFIRPFTDEAEKSNAPASQRRARA